MAKPREIDRRCFIKGAGLAVLTVQCLPLVLRAETGDHLVIESSSGFVPHVHDLVIPYAVLKAPPREGVEFTSTQAFLHQHKIALTQAQLTSVNQGGTVTQKASSHLFVIALAKGKNVR